MGVEANEPNFLSGYEDIGEKIDALIKMNAFKVAPIKYCEQY